MQVALPDGPSWPGRGRPLDAGARRRSLAKLRGNRCAKGESRGRSCIHVPMITELASDTASRVKRMHPSQV